MPGAPAGRLACGKRRVPAPAQKRKVAAAAAMTPYVNFPATTSARRCTGAVRACGESSHQEGGEQCGCVCGRVCVRERGSCHEGWE